MVAMSRVLRRKQPPEPAEVLRQIGDEVNDAAFKLKTGAVHARKQLKRQVNDVVKTIVDTVHEEAERLFDEQRDRAASKVAKVGKMVHQASHALHAVRLDGVADYVDSAADQVERASEYIQERNLNDMVQDAGEIVSQHKALAIGGLFVTGLAIGRFLKASESQAGEDDDAAEDDGEDDRSQRRRKRSKR